jgi:hypothetical protein
VMCSSIVNWIYSVDTLVKSNLPIRIHISLLSEHCFCLFDECVVKTKLGYVVSEEPLLSRLTRSCAPIYPEMVNDHEIDKGKVRFK